jgi:hypothetical protein
VEHFDAPMVGLDRHSRAVIGRNVPGVLIACEVDSHSADGWLKR